MERSSWGGLDPIDNEGEAAWQTQVLAQWWDCEGPVLGRSGSLKASNGHLSSVLLQ